MSQSSTRSCDGCTKCCEGYLSGEAFGKTFYAGKPCYFVTPGVGCAIYSERPADPCETYECLWKRSDTLPMWMKPSLVSVIVDERTTPNGIPYIKAHEAGSVMDARVLSWLIQYVLASGANLLWTVEGGPNYIGSPEFVAEMNGPGA